MNASGSSDLGGRAVAGPVAYALLFMVLLPAMLAAWAVRLDVLLALPVFGTRGLGIAIACCGTALMAGAIVALRVRGGGWPMSPYPPARFVHAGPYGIISDPIYVGAVIVVLGASVAARSGAGIWIVTPVLAASCAAFVLGYERDATVERFGPVSRPLLRLPAGTGPPDPADRISVYVLAFAPWMLAFEAVNALGARNAMEGWTSVDAAVPIVPWTEIVYFLTYPFVLAVPLVATTSAALRRFVRRAWIAIGGVTVVYLLFPVEVVPRSVPPSSFFATLMEWERQFGDSLTSLPAFHVIWALLAARVFCEALPRLRPLWWVAASAISVSCLTTGMHAIADVLAGAVVFFLLERDERIWKAIVRTAERIANAWTERNLGAVRLLGHSYYAGAGSLLGIAIVTALGGKGSLGAAVLVGASAIVGAAIWAQLVEGSSQLLRPFGYYGGIIGGCLGIMATPLFGSDPMRIFAAYAVAAPLVQAFGRLRCLGQGCCHGAPTAFPGIRYTNPRSRVVRLTDLGGVNVHATQLYSFLWSLLCAALAFRLWLSAAPLALIAGSYFVLNGLGRFVEEHYRGEPQTHKVASLPIYQWLAIGSIVAGAAITTIASSPAPAPGGLGALEWAVAASFGVVTFVAYGVDFPRLNCRFARLL